MKWKDPQVHRWHGRMPVTSSHCKEKCEKCWFGILLHILHFSISVILDQFRDNPRVSWVSAMAGLHPD
jgi:ABC-type phosphate/phosphonate transport system permease subunit